MRSEATLQRFAKRVQREAGGIGYAARPEGSNLNVVIFFDGEHRLRAEVSLEFLGRAPRSDVDMEATRVGLALRAAAATLPIAETG